MIILYNKSGEFGLEVYNGAEALKEAIASEDCPFAGAENISLRAGEMYLGDINGIEALNKLITELEPERASIDMDLYWDPVDTFIGRDKIAEKLKEKCNIPDDDLLFVLSNVLPDAFYGKMTEKELGAELQAAYIYAMAEGEE